MLACERGNTTPSVCSCAPRRSPVCAPAINWRARASPALQLLCAARRSVAQGWQGRAGGDTSGCAVTLGLPGLLPRRAGLVRTCRWLAGCSSSLRNLGNFGELQNTKIHLTSKFWALSLATTWSMTSTGKCLTLLAL